VQEGKEKGESKVPLEGLAIIQKSEEGQGLPFCGQQEAHQIPHELSSKLLASFHQADRRNYGK